LKQQARVVVIGGGIVVRECAIARKRVPLIDFTAFTKFELTGNCASNFLDRLFEAKIPGQSHQAAIIADSPYDPQTLFQW